MNFTNDKAIYIQMADRLCDEILAGTYSWRATVSYTTSADWVTSSLPGQRRK